MRAEPRARQPLMEFQLASQTQQRNPHRHLRNAPHAERSTWHMGRAWAGASKRKPMSGISHFIEHLMFKGTKKRTAKQITEAVEGLGGYLNAFTTEDHTCYYAKAAGQHFGTLCDVLSDMYLDSTFEEQEIEREREVIREEIMMYRDNPAQHAQELLSETMWQRHPAGPAAHGHRRDDCEVHPRRNSRSSWASITMGARPSSRRREMSRTRTSSSA